MEHVFTCIIFLKIYLSTLESEKDGMSRRDRDRRKDNYKQTPLWTHSRMRGSILQPWNHDLSWSRVVGPTKCTTQVLLAVYFFKATFKKWKLTYKLPLCGYNCALGMSLRKGFVDFLAIPYLGQRLSHLPETENGKTSKVCVGGVGTGEAPLEWLHLQFLKASPSSSKSLQSINPTPT